MTDEGEKMSEAIHKRERIGALAKGLDTRDPNLVCAAAYLYSELNGFPKLSDDFTYDPGMGMDSEAIRRWTLPSVFNEVDFKDYSHHNEDIEAGEILREYDDLQDIALYLYHQREDTIPPGMKRKVRELQDRSAEIEDYLREIENRLE